jgi:GNAT superfamily N-acetyltransferase
MPVRDATPDDLGEICAMVRELAEFEQAADEVSFATDDLRASLFGPDAVAAALVDEARTGGPVVGMAVWFRTFSTWLGRSGIWLEDLWVRPEHRRRGLGSELLDELSRRTDGRVEWSVLDWNDGAAAFYRRSGGHPVTGWTRWRLEPRQPGREPGR